MVEQLVWLKRLIDRLDWNFAKLGKRGLDLETSYQGVHDELNTVMGFGIDKQTTRPTVARRRNRSHGPLIDVEQPPYRGYVWLNTLERF